MQQKFDASNLESHAVKKKRKYLDKERDIKGKSPVIKTEN